METEDKYKIGFWTLLAIVINAQLGASIFLLPSKLASFGPQAILGWIVGGIGAISIAMVFAFLCLETTKTGGPHVYAQMVFGDKIGFFVTWLYWCGTWVCNPILISTSIDYLEQVTGPVSVITRFILEISIVESIMVVIKMLPLILVPILAITNLDKANFSTGTVTSPSTSMSLFGVIISSSIIAFWGFVGLEEGGSTADSVINPKKNVPLAIILGTSFVALISLINTVSIFGVIPCEQLKNMPAPFAVVLGKLLGGTYDKIIGILTFIMCYGSLNAWILFSGKLAQTAAEEKMFPLMFKKVNVNKSPYIALSIAALGTIIVLAILEFSPYKDALSDFLDMSVVMYIVLYLMAIVSYLFFIYKKKLAESEMTTGHVLRIFHYIRPIWQYIYN